MNKRIISALVLAGMIASTSAFALNARQQVLGTGGAGASNLFTKGAFHYEDAYNMFYNPSYVNDFKNWAAFEKGQNSTASNAEFGFVTSMMNLNMALWMNRAGATPNVTQAAGSQTLDLLIGGDMGVKWGLGFTYGKQDEAVPAAATNSRSYMAASLGAQFSGFDPYVDFVISGDDKDAAGTKTNKYTGMGAGFRYHYGEWTPYASFNSNKNTTEAVGAIAATELKTTTITVGVGREARLAEGAKIMYAIYGQDNKIADATNTNSFQSTFVVPVNLGVEVDALSWLTLRAGAVHTLLSSNTFRKNTTARIGGVFHVGKVDAEYAFGNGSTSGAGTGATNTSADNGNVGFDSGTFHNIGVKYAW